jgi:adenylate cyclase
LNKVQGLRSKVQSLQKPNPKSQEGAEACFHKAIDVARHQQAKSLELRAVMSLVRLRQQQGLGPGVRTTQRKTHTALTEAHQMLSEVYSWFTEGFDTKDLQEAKALLEKGAGRKGEVVTDKARVSPAK